jgi:hypothetical protein
MIQQTIHIPDKDLSLFLELVKKFRWKLDSTTTTNFELNAIQLDLLEKSSSTPSDLCISDEESLAKLNEL